MTAAPSLASRAMANDIGDAHWLPFTAMRQFRSNPMMFLAAEGMHYTSADGRRILDGMAGLWCVNAGHGQPRIVEAIREAAGRLDFVSSFKMTHPATFELAGRLAGIAPEGFGRVFFTNSGSEAVDSALKIARGYHRARGDAGRTKFIGRAKGYHGMGFGGLSVGGIGRHKRDFGPLLPDVAHLSLPYDRASMGFSRGQPDAGAHYADELESLLQINDPATVAAVIVEPVIGSGGVYPPPKEYLERLRSICSRHGILLIFDEVITGFGRLGTAFAAQALRVTPDLITCAKGMTNGAVPMGGVLIRDFIFDAFMAGPPEAIELFHGYTYSGHPLACAAGLAALDVYEELRLFERTAVIATTWQEALHSLRDEPHIADIRNIGLLGVVELAARKGEPGARGASCAQSCYDNGVLVRASGDLIVLSPPLIIDEEQIAQIVDSIRSAVRQMN
ncbi:aminotransferase class III-fold pyridoxal phosphate-dependent enzyme [Microvirga puerhi]|uniref:Aminotransferase class III-fold pyridoxal phosphate-dependent enzyme n=1 Tax=Microvirga puerhi TaxID=2876078 RepID=A0ABS7VQ59_9HYPH|nr:aminotransferase class III-fold pyridoxal phosphate-dependent enzyme [Microvirga puerhi]MBZ6077205.1 aminotransferase class III-fold pyridoxal phosphate-dependent enzyme [Microvirga puerhi]